MSETRSEPTKFELRRDATRQALIRHGVERFPVKGYSATTIADLVRDTGHTSGAFYFHFRSKEDFFVEVLRGAAGVREGWWEPVTDPANATLEAALGASLARLDDSDGGGPAWVNLVADFMQSARHRPDLIAEVRTMHRGWIAELRRFIDVARDRGLARTDLSPDELAERVLAVTDGFELHGALYELPGEGIFDVLVRLLRP